MASTGGSSDVIALAADAYSVVLDFMDRRTGPLFGDVSCGVAAGGRVLAIEAGRTILLEEAKVIEFANKHKLAIVSLLQPNANRNAA